MVSEDKLNGESIMDGIERINDKIDEIDERLRNVEICSSKKDAIIEQSIKSQEKVSVAIEKIGDTLNNINRNMDSMSIKLDNTNKEMCVKLDATNKEVSELKEELKVEVLNVDSKVESVDNRISAIEDSQTIKINWVQLVKKNLTRLILGVLSMGGLFAMIQELFKK